MKRKFINILPISDGHRKVNLLLDSLDIIENHFTLESTLLADLYSYSLSDINKSILFFSDLKSCAKFVLDNHADIKRNNISFILLTSHELDKSKHAKFTQFGMELLLNENELIKTNVTHIENYLNRVISEFKSTINITADKISNFEKIKLSTSTKNQDHSPLEINKISIHEIEETITHIKEKAAPIDGNISRIYQEENNPQTLFLKIYNEFTNDYFQNKLDKDQFFDKASNLIETKFHCKIFIESSYFSKSINKFGPLEQKTISSLLANKKLFKNAKKGLWQDHYFIKSYMQTTNTHDTLIVIFESILTPEQEVSFLTLLETINFIFVSVSLPSETTTNEASFIKKMMEDFFNLFKKSLKNEK